VEDKKSLRKKKKDLPRRNNEKVRLVWGESKPPLGPWKGKKRGAQPRILTQIIGRIKNIDARGDAKRWVQATGAPLAKSKGNLGNPSKNGAPSDEKKERGRWPRVSDEKEQIFGAQHGGIWTRSIGNQSGGSLKT